MIHICDMFLYKKDKTQRDMCGNLLQNSFTPIASFLVTSHLANQRGDFGCMAATKNIETLAARPQ
jgi:hypothetical protein